MQVALGASTMRVKIGHTSVEFVGALFVFFLIFFFPLLNLMGVAVSYGMICLLTHQIASRASTQATYASALNAMVDESSKLMSTGFANFLKIQRSGGYLNSSCDLYVVATKIGSGGSTTYGPDVPVTGTIDTTNNIYEYLVKSNFTVKPLIPMSGVPFIQNVPGLGQPLQVCFTADRAAEYAQGLAKSGGAIGGTVTPISLDNIAGPPPTVGLIAPSGGSGWKLPTILQMIANSGQTIVAEAIITVPANSVGWVPSGLTIAAGQSAWMDSHADGYWSRLPGDLTDANGKGPCTSGNCEYWVDPNYGAGALIAYVGSNPPNPTTPSTAPGLFLVGENLSEYPLPGSGPLVFIINDYPRSDDTGAQVVQVFITQ